MFDLAWSELALIALVALVVIGPKDLPNAVRGLARFVNKARGMASEFRGQLDEVVRESQLHEVKEEIDKLRRTDFRNEVINRIDPDGVMKDPFRPPFSAPSTPAEPGAPAPAGPDASVTATADGIAAEPPGVIGSESIPPNVPAEPVVAEAPVPPTEPSGRPHQAA